METENGIGNGDVDQQKDSNHLNGLSNGYSDHSKHHHKSHKSDKHRDKDKDRHRSSKDHKSSSSSSSKDKHHSSSSSKDKDKDKERHSSSSSHHKSSSSSSGKSKDKDKERSGDKDKDKDRHSSSSSSKKDDHKKSSSSSSSKDKDRHRSSSSSHHKSSSSSSKDKERSKHDDKDRHRHSSSSKDKHRDKEHNSSSKHHSKEAPRDEEEKNVNIEMSEPVFVKPDPVEIKPEVEVDSGRDESMDDDFKPTIKEEPKSQNSDQMEDVNVSAASSCDYSMSQFKDEPRDDLEEESDEDIPLHKKTSSHKNKLLSRIPKRKHISEDEDEDIPLSARATKVKKEEPTESDEERKATAKRIKIKKEKKLAKLKKEEAEAKAKTATSPTKRKKKEEEEQEVWKWWEEEKKNDGTKWKFLEHKGPVFAPDYERLPSHVKFYYDGSEMTLSDEAEEVAGFYARMLDHDYTTKEVFNNNFFKDWRKVMNDKERSKITDLRKCGFKKMHAYFLELSEKNKNRTKEEKLALKQKNEEMLKEYGFCTIDGHKEKIGNFKIEPPGLFRGRGEHPKMGMLKRRVTPRDILINCSKDSVIPKPPDGTKWKEVRHDPNVTWLASWTENVQNQVKYIMLNPSSKLKGEKDWQKYETARKLHKCIDKIRNEYHQDWKSKEMRIRQRAVALYFIDKLALRAGNEKDEDQADTVGCCSLRVEHIQLHEKRDDKEYVVVFDFLGKDSIRYYNEVPVEKRVFKNLQLFMDNKAPGDDLFDRLNTAIMNKHLNELMEGLTAKVFRTYNASRTLQEQLDLLTNGDDSVNEKILAYNRANRAVAILCNHQRAVPKGHEKSMEKLKEKIDAKRDSIRDAEKQVKEAKKDAKRGSVKEKVTFDKKKKMLERLREQLIKLEIQETDRDENKTIALGTSKLNYLDPRISVAWCKKYEVPIDKIYNKTQRDKFRWAIDMATADYRF